MSKTLGRLRELFEDPLFTRSSHGMVPTPRALELQKKLMSVLQDVQGLVSVKEFDPWTFRGEFKVAIPEYVGMAILPMLLEELQQEAPQMRIVAISRIEHQLEQLAEGTLDLAIQVKHAKYSSEYTLDPVASLPPVLLVRQGHPLRALKDELKSGEDWIDATQRYPRVSLYVPDLEQVDFTTPENVPREGFQRDVVFETSHMFTAIEVVKRTNCILVGPPFITRHPALGLGVTSIRLPVSEENYIRYVLVTHKRVESSAPHQWLRQKIIHIVRRIDQKRESGDPYSDYRVDRQIGFYGRNRED